MRGPDLHSERVNMGHPVTKSSSVVRDLRGASQLAVDAVAGVTDIVEAMHRNIAGLAPIVGDSRQGPTRGITGLVYGSVRSVTKWVGAGLDMALGQLAPLLGSADSSPRREAVLAALNGVLGDYLLESNNPLAIQMSLRQHGRPLRLEAQALAAGMGNPAGKLLVLAHGLCMNDLQWSRGDHDHGAMLAQELGYTALYLHYNSGCHISTNGQKFANLLEQLVQTWPVPVTELVIVGHSMGGLVSRSACHYAGQAGQIWLACLKKMVFIGTPHHGAPLERVGSWVDILLGISPYTAPFSRLGKIRSAGIKDLRHGNLLDADWAEQDRGHTHDARTPVPLPDGVTCFAMAATKQRVPGPAHRRTQSDGLVPVGSALGLHEDAALQLPIAPDHQSVHYGLDHFALLSSREVFARLKTWLA